VQYGGENASTGHLVAIEYTFDYKRGKKRGCKSLRIVFVRVRVYLLSRVVPFGSMKAEHLFVVDALCAACMYFLSEVISKIN
jgi:hypothetical protein